MSAWQPISTAPKNRTRVLLYFPGTGGCVVCGCWDDDRYAEKPRPYWTHDRDRIFGTRHTRENQPTHWQPLPEPPEAAAMTPAEDLVLEAAETALERRCEELRVAWRHRIATRKRNVMKAALAWQDAYRVAFRAREQARRAMQMEHVV